MLRAIESERQANLYFHQHHNGVHILKNINL